MKQLNILAITDIHYIGTANHICKVKDRRAQLALELVQRVLRSVDMHQIDLIALLGDLADNGNAPGAAADLEALHAVLKKTGKPVIVVPGNHDADPETVFGIFEDHEGFHEVEGYQIITFADEYGKDDTATRRMEKMQKAFAGIDPGKPILVLQHNPIYPPIEHSYPYNISNADQICGYYAEKGVQLSVSGHAHWGIPAAVRDNVGYLTCPALCEEPFKYTVITLKEKEYEIKEHSLVLKEFGLSDLHMHTDFAYCGENVEPGANIERAKIFGLEKIAFTEHAAQLYVEEKDYWSARFVNEPELLPQNRNTPWNRMKQYKETVGKYRSDRVLAGLEVEVDCNGNLTLLEEDLSGWDLLVGAVHYLPQKYEKGSLEGFMWANEALLRHGVHILAHPFRYFLRSKLPVPTELYKPLAELLAQYKTAAEINYHTNENDPRFFEICIAHKVPISLGSDGHHLSEIGSFQRHLALLRQICPMDRLQDIFYKI